MPKADLAIVTMVYNEPDFLPFWTSYYSNVVGFKNCFVLDHGSNDDTVFDPRVNLVGIPRSPLDEPWRANLVSDFCNHLLSKYHAVCYTDVDEILVADPKYYVNLVELAIKAQEGVITAIGSDVLQIQGNEKALNLREKVSLQRKWIRPFWSLCKPSLIKRPIKWGPGFHYGDTPTIFGGLFLFHIAYSDFYIIRKRQQKRVSVEKISGSGEHHNIDPDEMVMHIAKDYSSLPQVNNVVMDSSCPYLSAFIDDLFKKQEMAFGGLILSSGPQSNELWQLPNRFIGLF